MLNLYCESVTSHSECIRKLLCYVVHPLLSSSLLAVMVCFVLESSGIFMAGKGELPNGLVKKFPPPDDVVVLEDTSAPAQGTDSA